MNRRSFQVAAIALCAAACITSPRGAAAQTVPLTHKFNVARPSEAVLTLTAECRRCDWAVSGREAAALRIEIDGEYSQHVLLTRGDRVEQYSVLLGPLAGGAHAVTIARDDHRSAVEAGDVRVVDVDVTAFDPASAESAWIRTAPILHARPGTIERFSDVPLMSYVERLPGKHGFRYTIIFSHEDGGTPTDRLMATWGRSTDIEFVYEWERGPNGVQQVYQGADHAILPFKGQYLGEHPLLWVATENNMVSDAGPVDAIRFAPVPRLEDLTNVSREMVMDANPWLYRVMTAELAREGRIDPAAAAGSGKIPHPSRFGYIEGCGDLRDATLAFDVAVRTGERTTWHATDRGDSRFRIARSGCFRAAVPLPEGVRGSQIRGLRARAYTRPPRRNEAPLPAGSGAAILRRVNTIFMLDEQFTPRPTGAQWAGTLALPVDGAGLEVAIR